MRGIFKKSREERDKKKGEERQERKENAQIHRDVTLVLYLEMNSPSAHFLSKCHAIVVVFFWLVLLFVQQNALYTLSPTHHLFCGPGRDLLL